MSKLSDATIKLLRRFKYVKDLEKASENAAKIISGDARIMDIAIENGVFTMDVSSELVRVMAAHMATLLDGHNAENYIEMKMTHDDGRQFVVTIQRCEGKTPHELRVEAESKLNKYLSSASKD